MLSRISVHTYIHSMNSRVTIIRGRGTRHKYTNIQNIYGAQYYKHFTLPYYRSSLHIKKFTYRVKEVYLSIFLMLLCVGGTSFSIGVLLEQNDTEKIVLPCLSKHPKLCQNRILYFTFLLRLLKIFLFLTIYDRP